MGARNLKRAPDFSLFDTCFDLSGKTEVKVPTVVMHFKGADVSLPASNYLIPVDSDGTFCFAFAVKITECFGSRRIRNFDLFDSRLSLQKMRIELCQTISVWNSGKDIYYNR
ncbi:hypothetical protein K7X08_036133 [Anisodus acutangulus]|uniref:Peptidase A1 domain-containing protein n=1 Tax=Anisodus acutangulus TaxID=402998 RepID=A0A9Q1L4M5_9SOLA|nr:hypothetical protein K7X08_036133 [Anisodus acutangulus]